MRQERGSTHMNALLGAVGQGGLVVQRFRDGRQAGRRALSARGQRARRALEQEEGLLLHAWGQDGGMR